MPLRPQGDVDHTGADLIGLAVDLAKGARCVEQFDRHGTIGALGDRSRSRGHEICRKAMARRQIVAQLQCDIRSPRPLA